MVIQQVSSEKSNKGFTNKDKIVEVDGMNNKEVGTVQANMKTPKRTFEFNSERRN